MITWKTRAPAALNRISRWRNWLSRHKAAPAVDAAPELVSDTTVDRFDIDPFDPLLAYLEENPRVVAVDRIPLQSPAVDALRQDGIAVVVPLVTHGKLIGMINLGSRLSGQEYSRDDLALLENLAMQSSAALRVAQLVREQQASMQERERIARELHDVIVQRLYAAGMRLDRVRRRMTRRFARADAARLSEAIDEVDGTIAEVRKTVRELRSAEPESPSPSPSVDLAESARGEVRVAGELLGYPPTLELSGELADIPTGPADHVRAALREALSNVVRHSGASETRVELHRDPQGVRLRVRDNGCGVPRDVAQRGLRHLAERAEAAGGQYKVTSSPTLGTLLSFDIPLSHDR
jgi:signal transduction histidine kinase